jgi:MFS superfamily sulfate permease-like transporter
VERHPENVVDPAVTVLRPETGLYFANADRLRADIREAAAVEGVRGVVIDLATVPTVDLTAARMLHETGEQLAHAGQRLVLTHDIGQVRDQLAAGGAEVDVYPSIDAAAAAIRSGASAITAPIAEEEPA